ncbi:hypothetical protein ACQPYK_49715 (plasmid) [Streptosporangium sp. CA-135522]|uniref:hypothetical protein n=1 Tax=Streptosporangium sp. CA-135522 TaxID=3240072 RepID=UPI003D89EC74
MAKRRLTKTLVEQTVQETKTREFIEHVGLTYTKADGRRELDIRLFDAFDDPRQTPAGKALIERLEASGWSVAHRHGRLYSRLTVSEPIAAPEER